MQSDAAGTALSDAACHPNLIGGNQQLAQPSAGCGITNLHSGVLAEMEQPRDFAVPKPALSQWARHVFDMCPEARNRRVAIVVKIAFPFRFVGYIFSMPRR